MGVPKNYANQLREALGAKAVWEPGSPVQLGDILTERDGSFNPSGRLSEYGIKLETATNQNVKLNLKSSGTSERLFQAGAEVPASALRPDLEASIEYSFKGEFEYALKSDDIDVDQIVNVNQVAKAVLGVDEWRHEKWYIVERVYRSGQWSFLGSRKTSKSFKVSGKGSAIGQFLSVGASAGISRSGSIDLELLGEGGALAMRVVRIRKDGTTDRG